jgi:hypothetical protein
MAGDRRRTGTRPDRFHRGGGHRQEPPRQPPALAGVQVLDRGRLGPGEPGEQADDEQGQHQ